MVNPPKIKIAWLFEYSPTTRDIERFGILKLQQYGFEIAVIDVSGILIYDSKEHYKNASYHKNINYIPCKSVTHTISLVKKLKPDFLFSLVYVKIFRRYLHRLFLHNILSKKVPIIEYRGPNGPFQTDFKNPTFIQLVKDFVNSVVFGPLFFRNASYSFIGGSKVLENATGSPIFSHSLDYDLFLKAKEEEKQFRYDAEYILFLDEDFVFHEDYKLLGIKPPVTAENYYAEVNYMLNRLGDIFGLKPVIQVHPSADRNLAEKYYDFPLSEDKTIDAVKNAELIVSHDSTALQMAVFCNKPVVLLETSEIVRSEYYHTQIHCFADALGCSVLTPEDFKKDLEFPKVCEQSYARYIDEYIKTDLSDQRYSYEVLAAYLENQIRPKTN